MPMKFFILYLSAIGLFLSNILAHDPASDMAAAANRFLKSLDPNAKKIAQFTFKSAERENWHFFPGPFIRPDGRQGLSLKDMSPAQKILAHGLLGSALSHRGLLETTDVILLEQILYEREEREMRNPELYHVSVSYTHLTLPTNSLV